MSKYYNNEIPVYINVVFANRQSGKTYYENKKIKKTKEDKKIDRVSLLDVNTDYKLKDILNEIIDKINGE